MGDKTGISWTDTTWNPVRGCSRVSEGCRHCYAESMAARIVRMGKGKPTPYDGLVKHVGDEPRWTGEVVLDQVKIGDPLRWREPRRVFVNSMSDLFHDKLDDAAIIDVFAIMALAPRHTFQVLTKRARRMRSMMTTRDLRARVLGRAWEMLGRVGIGRVIARPDRYKHDGVTKRPWPLPNVWLGTSVENQAAADERIPDLLATPAAVRFLSCEPLLGEVDLIATQESVVDPAPWIDWVIAGCESGHGARPCDVAWLRALRDQCAAAGTAFFLKQAVRDNSTGPGSSFTARVSDGRGSKCKPGGVIELPYLDGVQHAAMPETSKAMEGGR